MEKEFGKLSHEQFAKLVSELPEVRKQMHELPELLKKKKRTSGRNFQRWMCFVGDDLRISIS